MSVVNNDRIFGIHADALRLREQSLRVHAENIANADTPGYKARAMSFDSALAGALKPSQLGSHQQTLKTEHPGHLSQASGSGRVETGYRIPAQPALDGNTVDMDHERVAYMQEAISYQATLSFLNSRIQGINSALKGE